MDGSAAASRPGFLTAVRSTRRSIVLAPDGRFWSSDGHCIVRLNGAGVADLVLGQPPQSEKLESIAGIAVDNQARIYAVDARSGSIHIFDAAGRFLRVCRAKPTDVKEPIWDPALAVTEHGDVYLGLSGNYRFPMKRARLLISRRTARGSAT